MKKFSHIWPTCLVIAAIITTFDAKAVVELSTAQTAASKPVQSERLAYDLKIGGIHVADFIAEFDESASSYRTALTMETKGFARWLQDFRAELTSGGTITIQTGQGPTPVPQYFDRKWAALETASTMTIAYDGITGLASKDERLFNPITGEDIAFEDLYWNRNQEVPTPVPDSMRTGVLDPMAAFVAARSQIIYSGREDFRVPIYDGRRRYDLVGTVESPRMYWIKGKEVELIPVVAGIEPVFGFNQRRKETMRESFGKILFSTDERFIPIQVIIEGTTLTSVMNLTADCHADLPACQQGAQTRPELSVSP